MTIQGTLPSSSDCDSSACSCTGGVEECTGGTNGPVGADWDVDDANECMEIDGCTIGVVSCKGTGVDGSGVCIEERGICKGGIEGCERCIDSFDVSVGSCVC